jgi:hypothetical protein
MSTLTTARGCGTRTRGGVYIESGLSANGRPLEEFLFDPPLTFEFYADAGAGDPAWFKPHRSPIVFEHAGAKHLMFWVGEEHYPDVWDFIEETRVLGASRKVSRTFDFSQLTPSSRMFFVHPNAHVIGRCNGDDAVQSLPRCCTERHSNLRTVAAGLALSDCLSNALLLPVTSTGGYDWKAADDSHGTQGVRTLPCGHAYSRYTMKDAVLLSQPGIFMWLPITGVAMIKQQDGSVDPIVRDRVQRAAVATFEREE